jgi:hypothetical protein
MTALCYSYTDDSVMLVILMTALCYSYTDDSVMLQLY